MSIRKSIKRKLIFDIITPLIIIVIIFGVFITAFGGKNFSNMQSDAVEEKSLAASYQVNVFFTKYMEIVNQMACNEAILQMMRDMKAPGDALTVSSYDMAETCLNNILNCDEAISLAWTVDLDSGDSVRSSGITRGLTIDDYDVTTRDWYIQAMDAGKLIITEPYIDTLSQTLVTSVIRPAYDVDGSMIGLVAVDMTLATLDSTMKSYTLGKNGIFFMVTENGTIMYHPNNEKITLNISEGGFSDAIVNDINNGESGQIIYNYEDIQYHGYISNVGDTGWRIISGMPESEFYERTFILIFQVALLMVIIAIILFIILHRVSKSIIKPINNLTGCADEIANGNLDVEINITSEDETGLVAKALERTIVKLKDYKVYIDEISVALDELAKGNLELTLQQTYEGEFYKIKESLENFFSAFKEVMTQINSSSGQVANASRQVSAGAQSLVDGTMTQTSSVEALSSSIEDIIEQMEQSNIYAQQASEIADEEEEHINESKKKMEQLLEAIHEINLKSDKIGATIKTIDSIAKQTNMLSLNASIEAVRAGEAGKGFAVVAGEVSDLAKKSTEASRNISVLIADTLKAVNEGVRLATESGEIQDMVVSKANKTNEIMRAIAKHTNEHSLLSTNITKELNDISAVVQHTLSTAKESSAASEELSSQAELLNSMVSRFKLK